MKKGRDATAQKEKRKQILVDTRNSRSHKDECANENTMDMPMTREVRIKRNRWQMLYEVNKHRTELMGWLMPPTKFSSKKLKKENYIPIMFYMQ